MNFHRKKKQALEITLTPMIDVVFLLLIFFMVTTTFNRETELKIKLPEAQGDEKEEQTKVINLTIDADGIYYVNNRQIINQKLSTLRKALVEAAGNTRQTPFIINADAKTPHQFVISALDIAAQIGFTRITFAAKAPPQGSQ
jgi:biopolymer transport protein ExbD